MDFKCDFSVRKYYLNFYIILINPLNSLPTASGLKKKSIVNLDFESQNARHLNQWGSVALAGVLGFLKRLRVPWLSSFVTEMVLGLSETSPGTLKMLKYMVCQTPFSFG